MMYIVFMHKETILLHFVPFQGDGSNETVRQVWWKSIF